MMTDPPPNPLGGKTLIVDANDGDSYPRPSAALLDAGEHDQVFVRSGIYEDKVFITGRPIRLVGHSRGSGIMSVGATTISVLRYGILGAIQSSSGTGVGKIC